MKRYKHIVAAIVIAAFLAVAAPASAQMMYGANADSTSSNADVQKGQEVYNQLQNKQTTCDKLTDDNFDVLGDFYMARMMGVATHSTMDQQMTEHMGDTANTEIHVALAKRLSGCDPNATYPASAGSYAPVAGMTGMMDSGMMNGNWNMMGGYNNSSWSGTNTLLTVLLVLAIAAAVFAWFRPRNIIAAKKNKR